MFQNPLIQHFSVFKNSAELSRKYVFNQFTDPTFLPQNNFGNKVGGFYGRNIDRRGYGLFFSCWAGQNSVHRHHNEDELFTKMPSFQTINLNNNHDSINGSKIDFEADLNSDLKHHNTHNHVLQSHNVSTQYQKNDETLKPVQGRLNKRRSRTNFTDHQLETLEATFRCHHYPDLSACERLSKQLLLSSPTIQIWFQNRRAKWRRQENTRRGPGRPSNNAPRRSCSGEPIRGSDQEEMACLKHGQKSMEKGAFEDSHEFNGGRKYETYLVNSEFESYEDDKKDFEKFSFESCGNNEDEREDQEDTKLPECKAYLQIGFTNKYYKDNKDNKYHKDNKYYKDNKDNTYHKDNKDSTYHKDSKDSTYHKDNKDNAYHKANKDNKDNKGKTFLPFNIENLLAN